MKKLMMVVAICLAGAAAFAAQCEGVTQKGERCKREAAEKKGKESQIVSCCVKKILDSRSDLVSTIFFTL